MAMLVVEIKDVLLGFAIDEIHLEWDSVQSFKHRLKTPINIDRVFPVIRVRLKFTANGLKGQCSLFYCSRKWRNNTIYRNKKIV
jgi:hypothetical protein